MTYIPGGNSSGGSGKISTGGDVALNNVFDGEVLGYDTAIGKWTNITSPFSSLLEELSRLQARLVTLENANGSSTGSVVNPTFDTNIDGWHAEPNTAIVHSTDTPHLGLGCLRLTSQANGLIGVYSDAFTVTAGSYYDASVFVRSAQSTNRNTGLQIDWFASNGAYISSSTHYSPSGLSWGERAVSAAVAPSGAVSANLKVAITSTLSGEVFYIDDCYLKTVNSPPVAGGAIVFEDSFDGPNATPYVPQSDPNSPTPKHVKWNVEGNWCEAVNRSNNSLVKVGTTQFHRMFSNKRLGGPGKTILITTRARATRIYDRPEWSGVPGFKVGLVFPGDPARTSKGFSRDDYRASWGYSNDTCSLTVLPGTTLNGYIEIARQGGYDDATDGNNYTYGGPRKNFGYTVGTWKDMSIEFSWTASRTIHTRLWHNLTQTGTPIAEWTDNFAVSEYYNQPAFLRLRTDDTDFECEYITVKEL